jgi:putative restriction endonuclease
VQFYTGVTDRQWFNQLHLSNADEVVFWKPGAPQNWQQIPVGAPFLYKLRGAAPHVIAGGGFFVGYSRMPVSIAWATFGKKNGRKTLEDFRQTINSITKETLLDPPVGCIVLTQTFFFNPEEWIPLDNWKIYAGAGKSCDTSEVQWAKVWDAVTERLNYVNFMDLGEYERFQERTILQRVGQGGFRVLVMDAYNRRCAITGEKTLPVLQASHIKPYSEEGTHFVNNGLLLRSDIHTLFDAGYITITPDHRVEVSSRIRTEFENGRDYYALHGKELISLPEKKISQPDPELLIWHNEHKFAA